MARRVAKRRFSVFSLSFLDVMSCGFGAVVLIFLIIHHRIDNDTVEVDRELFAESRKLDYLIAVGEENRVDLQQRLEDARKRVGDARRQLLAKAEDRDRRRRDMEDLEARSIAQRESVEALKADVQSREEEVKRLQAEEDAARGNRVREVVGEGDRQYLTGLFVGGNHVLIAVDASASMLDSTIVQILRRRNMSAERRRNAPKWQRALRTVQWLAAQLPLESHFQIATYGADATFMLPQRDWHATTHPTAIDDALNNLAQVLPDDGTNLDSLMARIVAMKPHPDNVFLITDGLPTRAERAPRQATVAGRQRLRLFSDAVKKLPKGIPVNPILLPLEGDPQASAAYWMLAIASGGTYMSPSEDWP